MEFLFVITKSLMMLLALKFRASAALDMLSLFNHANIPIAMTLQMATVRKICFLYLAICTTDPPVFGTVHCLYLVLSLWFVPRTVRGFCRQRLFALDYLSWCLVCLSSGW